MEGTTKGREILLEGYKVKNKSVETLESDVYLAFTK
jgi:hypothetical protein